MLTAVSLCGIGASAEEAQNPWFEVMVVDSVTGKGLPNVELVRNGLIRYVTDSAGRVAIIEPDFMNQKVYFDVKIDGYDPASSNPLQPGVVLNVVPGGSETIKLKRKMIAEPAYRITGSGIFNYSAILGKPVPIDDPYSGDGVMNKDNFFDGRTGYRKFCVSPQSVVYKGKVYWFYNGLRGMSFSQKNYRMAIATSELPGSGNTDPDKAIDLDFILDGKGFPKEVAPFGSSGDIVWFDSVMTVKDASGNDRLVAHYTIYSSNSTKKEHGLAVYNDKNQVFDKLTVFDLNEEWAYPHGRNFKHEENGIEYLYFGNTFPTIRVPATFEAIQNPSKYEAWSCYADNSTSKVLRNKKGQLIYRWTKNAKPAGQDEEKSLIRKSIIDESEAMFLPEDEGGNQISFQAGSVNWNPYKGKWVFVGTQQGGNPSSYGEIWYSEAFRPTGPWEKAVKVVTNNNYSLVNVVHHPMLDSDGGRVIYFDGTYTTELSSNSMPKMMYDNNQLMFRLQLNDSRIMSAFKDIEDKTPPEPDTPPDIDTPTPPETPGETPVPTQSPTETQGEDTPMPPGTPDDTPTVPPDDETPTQSGIEGPGDEVSSPPKTPQESPLPADPPAGTGDDISIIIYYLAAASLLVISGIYLLRRRIPNK